VRLIQAEAHSRYPIYREQLDDVIGMIHIKDVLAYWGTAKKFNLRDILRRVVFVAPTLPVLDMLLDMRRSRTHMALVVDEFGGTDGLLTIEDLVEEIVGEIEDEHDEAAPATVVQQSDGSFLADARASLEDVTHTVGVEFDVGEAAEEVDTIGGYLMAQVGRLPLRGELVPGPGPFEIEVLDADPRRVKKIRIYRSKPRPVAIDGGKRGVAPLRPPAEGAGARVELSPPAADTSSKSAPQP
jgi:CBS domain containing-hemolysin-like protein